MKRLLAAMVLAACLLPVVGCCSTSCPGRDIPVSLESLYNFNHYFGRCAFSYPYSCPSCPYNCGHCGQATYEYPVSVRDAGQAVPLLEPAPEPPLPDPQ